ncbi:ADP-glyceromanno-heptose 6-epimerase [Mailhella massiliensis]|uniref:ADP-L-glycero-D-manno-heptose-6-epimerase n=1 Tax=Mailhella massiliensis TaxID=1903261 RepID=A0A921AUL2_9BACT|nr:ADP-glyceromanno-heptose 6-epimerase [Mailhella massiliensis]HJD96190.1 ADP-glyceromanno-heptose 6-epimerase [Mailhella massiliensis]
MIIVTGGAGLIGANMIWELNRQGEDDILVVDNLASTEKWKNLSHLRYSNYMHRDRFLEELRSGKKLEGVDCVIHMGACSSTTERNADFLMENNFHYTVELCLASLEAGARFITASSAATYGDGELGFSDSLDIMPKLRPLNMYGYSKKLFDMWCLRHKLLGEVVNLKFFNVYGPDEYHKGSMMSMVCRAVPQVKETGKIRLFKSDNPHYGDGESVRDFVYSKDCAALMCWFMETPSCNGIFNVGTGRARSWNDLAKAVFSSMDREENIEYFDMPEHLKGKYQYFTEADMSWLERENCPVKFHSLEEGVDDYVRNYLMQDDPYLCSL